VEIADIDAFVANDKKSGVAPGNSLMADHEIVVCSTADRVFTRTQEECPHAIV
jgi:hypothetical protein